MFKIAFKYGYGSFIKGFLFVNLTDYWRRLNDNKIMKGKMLAYCGLRCDTCPIHLATIEKDEERKFEMRVSIVEQINRQYNKDLMPEDISDCDGCKAKGGRLFTGCLGCEIRNCALQRNIESCAYCDEFGCEKLQKHFCLDPESFSRLEELRANN